MVEPLVFAGLMFFGILVVFVSMIIGSGFGYSVAKSPRWRPRWTSTGTVCAAALIMSAPTKLFNSHVLRDVHKGQFYGAP